MMIQLVFTVSLVPIFVLCQYEWLISEHVSPLHIKTHGKIVMLIRHFRVNDETIR